MNRKVSEVNLVISGRCLCGLLEGVVSAIPALKCGARALAAASADKPMTGVMGSVERRITRGREVLAALSSPSRISLRRASQASGVIVSMTPPPRTSVRGIQCPIERFFSLVDRVAAPTLGRMLELPESIVSRLLLPCWTSLYQRERVEVLTAVLDALPPDSLLLEVRRFSTAVDAPLIARFEIDGSIFSLVPGGHVTLGYERRVASPFSPAVDQCLRGVPAYVAQWPLEPGENRLAMIDEILASFTLELDAWPEHLDQVLSPRRSVDVAPALIEVESHRVAVSRIRIDDPRYQAASKRVPPRGYSSSSTLGGVHCEWFLDDTNELVVLEVPWLTHSQTRDHVEREGFHLLTGDAWEHACSGGTDAMFHWGNTLPIDSPARQRDPRIDGEPPRFTRHTEHNAFGLIIASDPYRWEAIADDNQVRGGDGGSSVCGGEGLFRPWITLASSYTHALGDRHDAGVPGLLARRSLPIVAAGPSA